MDFGVVSGHFTVWCLVLIVQSSEKNGPCSQDRGAGGAVKAPKALLHSVETVSSIAVVGKW